MWKPAFYALAVAAAYTPVPGYCAGLEPDSRQRAPLDVADAESHAAVQDTDALTLDAWPPTATTARSHVNCDRNARRAQVDERGSIDGGARCAAQTEPALPG